MMDMPQKPEETKRFDVLKRRFFPRFSGSKLNMNELVYDAVVLLFPFLLEDIYEPVMSSYLFGIPFPMLFI